MNANKDNLSGLLVIALAGALLLIAGAACAPNGAEALAAGSEPTALDVTANEAAAAPEFESIAAETADVAPAAPAAQTDDGDATGDESESVTPPCGGPLGGMFGAHGPGPHFGEATPGIARVDPEAMHAAIAGALGISVETLEEAMASGTPLYVLAEENDVEMETVREAMEAVREAAIDQALAEGTITEEQAEWLRSRPGSGGFGGMFGGPGPHFGEEAPSMALVDPEAMHAAIAGALGISVEALEEAMASGTPLYVLADENGVDIESVREAMEAVREAAIDQALADGTITEEQAEWLRNRPGPGGFGGMFGGPGTGRGMPGNPGRGMRGGHGHGPQGSGPGGGPFGGGNGLNGPSS